MSWGYKHESNQSENERFHNACRDAGLSSTQEREFSHYLHDSGQNEERMEYQEIRNLAEDWLRS